MSLLRVRRFWLAGVVLAAVLALVPFSFHSERHLETATRVEGSEAESVVEELASRFHSPFVDRVVLVVQGLPPADSDEGEQALAKIVEGLREEPGVSGIVSRLDNRDPIFLGKGGGSFVLIGLASTEGPVESLVPKLHERARSLQNQLRGRYPAVKLELTGETPLNFDIRKASADDVRHGETLVIPMTLALLLLAFGSLVAAVIPLAVGQLAIATALAIAGFLALRWHLSILVQTLATMLGLGLGIDYALLMVSRFREAIAAGHNGLKASMIAARQAGHTLLISASTVAIGFLALLTVPISEVRSIGVAGFLVAGMSLLLTITLVPAVLALLGPRINAGRLPFTAKKALEAVGEGDRRPSLACHPCGRYTLASAGFAGRAARYQSSQGELASASGGIGSRASHAGTNGSGRRRPGVARDSRTSNGFHRANGRGVEYARSFHQTARERPSLRPRDLYHNHGGEQPVFSRQPLA
jgi:putative drug exporter of the RND superfamily